MRRTAGLLAMTLWLARASLLAGQQPEAEVQWLWLGQWDAEMELLYETEDEETKYKTGTSSSKANYESFREIFTISNSGYVYHPRFLDFDVSLGMEYDQSDGSREGAFGSERDSRNGDAPRYSLSGIFLKEHQTSLSFAMHRFSSTVARAFSNLAEVSDESQQVTLYHKHEFLPMRATFFHSVTERREFGDLAENRDEELTTFEYVAEYDENDITSGFTYEYSDNTEDVTYVDSGADTIRILRQYHRLTHNAVFRFGPTRNSFFRSLASYTDESGTYMGNRLLVSELLHMQHTEDLGSDFTLDYSNQEFEDAQTERLAASAGITHQLYDSLLSSAEVYSEQEDFGEFTRDRYGSAVAFDYRKLIPYGMLSANLGGGYSQTTEDGGMTTVRVLDERHRLSGTATSLLKNSKAVDTSVTVTNSSGTTTYTRDIDYRVTSRGSRVEIARLAAGAIPSGSTVLVDYSYEVDEPLEYNTTDTAAGVKLDLFDHFSVYVSRQSSEHDVTSGVEQDRLDDLTSTLYGASTFWGPARLTVEHEEHESSLSPYTADTIRFDFQQRFARYHNVALNTLDRRVTFDETGDEDFSSLAATYQFAARDWPMLEVTVGSENEDRFGFSEDRNFARVEARYRIRATEFSLTYRHNKRDNDSQEKTEDYFLFSILRKF